MYLPSFLSGKLGCLNNTLVFFKKHLGVIMALGLIAAFGRVIQLEGFGPITPWMNIVLEIVVESVRVLLFLYVLGLASIKNGMLRVGRLFTHKDQRKIHWKVAIQKLKKQWFLLVINLVAFLFLAWVMNYLIDLLAYETCLYLSLKKDGILADAASEWTIILFFKNLSVIPLTLIFDAVLLLWLTNKVRHTTVTVQE
jgi:hypothetical protein